MSDGAIRSRRWPSILVAVLGVSSLGVFFSIFVRNIPEFKAQDAALLKNFPPKDVAQLAQQRDVLLTYAKQYPVFVLGAICQVYVIMQMFAIPGTLTLSVLSGAIYGTSFGLLLVTFISTLGATCCYLLSRSMGKGIAKALWPAKVEAFGKEIDKRRGDMFNYIVFLRLTPILPNTFINVASPVVRVPIWPFIIGTFFGCIPNNVMAVSTGSKLGKLESLSELYDIWQVLFGLLLGVVALMPIYFKKRKKLHGI